MSLLRMDNVLIVVDDLEAATAFFVEIGMELEGEAPVEGLWVDRVVGLDDVRQHVAAHSTSTGGLKFAVDAPLPWVAPHFKSGLGKAHAPPGYWGDTTGRCGWPR